MENNDLYHYGVKGQKWGVRRYQNKDGTLTAVGKSRYKTDEESDRALLSRVKDDSDDEGWINLHKEIHAKSGNLYFGESVSSRFSKTLIDHDRRKKEIDDQYGVTAAEKVAGEAFSKWRDYHSTLTNDEIAKHPRYSELDSEIKSLSDKYFDRYKKMSEADILKNKDEILKRVNEFNQERKPLEEEKNKIWRKMMDNVNADTTLNKLSEDRFRASDALRDITRNPAYQKALLENDKDFETRIHGVVLTDLGYRNTARGRQFLIDNMLVFDD